MNQGYFQTVNIEHEGGSDEFDMDCEGVRSLPLKAG
jgi:hypothetical protein